MANEENEFYLTQTCLYEGKSGGGASAGDIGAGRGQPCGSGTQGARASGQTKVLRALPHPHYNSFLFFFFQVNIFIHLNTLL